MELSFTFRCEQCVLLDTTLTQIQLLIQRNTNISDEIQIRLMKSFTRDSDLVSEWKKHQLRTVHQEEARDYVLQCLDEKSVSKYKCYSCKVVNVKCFLLKF
jgi:hypothetical protein